MQSLRLPPRNIHKIEPTAVSEIHLWCVVRFGLQWDCKFGGVINRLWFSKAISLRVLRCRLPDDFAPKAPASKKRRNSVFFPTSFSRLEVALLNYSEETEA
jgi:hypothetical protein